MATVHVTFSAAMHKAIPVPSASPASAETITSSGTSAAASITAGAADVCSITATGGNIWAKFGASPTAASGDDILVLDGQTRDFGGLQPSWTVAVIDA